MNWHLLQNSVVLAGLATAGSVTLGAMVALWVLGLRGRWRTLVFGLGAVALVLPPFLVTSTWIDLAGATGIWREWWPIPIYSIWGSAWVLVMLTWPIGMFLAASAWKRVERAQLESEVLLRGWNLIRFLLLPVAAPALGQAALITFVLAFNNFAVPAILQTKVFPAEVWIQFSTTFDYGRALLLSLPLVGVPVLLLWWLSRRGFEWPLMEGAVMPGQWRDQVGRVWFAGAGITSIALLFFSAGVPLVQLLGSRDTWLELGSVFDAGRAAFWNSLWSAAGASAICVILGIGVWRWRAGGALFWLCFLVPGVLLGITLTYLFNRAFVYPFYQSFGIVVLALVVRYGALSWSGARLAMRTADPELGAAARLEGANRWQEFKYGYWPQLAPMMGAVGYLTYLLCLWDAETLTLIVPPGGETLALRTFHLLHYGHVDQVNALCTLLLALALIPGVLWLVWCSRNRWPFAARDFSARRGASDAHIPKWVNTTLMSRGLASARYRWSLFISIGLLSILAAGCGQSLAPNETRIESSIFRSVQIIGSRGTGAGQFNKPRSLAVDAQDNLYVADTTGRVQKFSPDGEFLLAWHMPEIERGKPKGMGRDADGNIIVVEPHYARVNHFSPEGKLIDQWGTHGTANGQFTLPRAVAVNSKGEIHIVEYTRRDRVQVFSRGEKHWIRSFGRGGNGPGEFNRLEGISIDLEDRVYLADSCNHRIQVLTGNGEFLRAFGRAGSGPGELSYPYDLVLDRAGYLFVCEFGNSRLQVFDANGASIEILGRAGARPGQFNNPWAIALDSKGNLYVADGMNHRVQKLIRKPGTMDGVVDRRTS